MLSESTKKNTKANAKEEPQKVDCGDGDGEEEREDEEWEEGEEEDWEGWEEDWEWKEGEDEWEDDKNEEVVPAKRKGKLVDKKSAAGELKEEAVGKRGVAEKRKATQDVEAAAEKHAEKHEPEGETVEDDEEEDEEDEEEEDEEAGDEEAGDEMEVEGECEQEKPSRKLLTSSDFLQMHGFSCSEDEDISVVVASVRVVAGS